MKSKIEGQEAGIYERMANVQMSQAVGVHVDLSPESNKFCFYLCLTSRGLKQPVNKNCLPGERLEEHKQWCGYRQIFLASCFARLCITLQPANPSVLQAKTSAKRTRSTFYPKRYLIIYVLDYMSNNEEARFAVTPSFVLTHSSDSI